MSPSFLLLLIPLVPISLLAILALIVRPKPIRIPIKSRHVFITGGSSGIGLALAHRAATEGARVSILARSAKKLEEAKQSIKLATGVEVATFSADVRDYDAVSKAIDESGPIDVLIVNQGVFVARELEKHSVEDVKFTIDVNLMGSFNVIKAALPAMKAREGRGPASISLLSSQAGQVGVYGYAAYSASKFGLQGLAQSLQQEVIADDIHVTLVFPPDTDTPGFEEEQKSRPEVTSIIAASSGSMKTEEVAKRAMNGIKAGKFTVSCNFEGFLLSLATTGMSPQRSFWLAFLEVITAGPIRELETYHSSSETKETLVATLADSFAAMAMSLLKLRSAANVSPIGVLSRAFSKLSEGTDITSAAPGVSLQKARTWDEGVSSKFSTTPLTDIFKGKKVVIFGLPGAYTGVCSQQHVPSYKSHMDKFKAKGIDSVICVSVNDPYTINGWAEKIGAKDAIEFYGDFDGKFHKSLGLDKDLSVALLGPRSERWSAYVEDGKVKAVNVEEAPSDFKVSGAEVILGQI
ncbi:3-dehydrosphinganine reductase TSC10B [Hirschfeldia incana]|nr:3-dehydrosphinganine reductase TSC10B [Hirschfeldia incana]